jgi:NAD(P)H dehydrogenase (quinone)
VYLSFINAAPDSIFTLARDHHATEEHVRATGIPFTFLRMSLYMDYIPFLLSADGVITGPAGDGRVAAILRDDIADTAASVLTSDGHEGETYTLTGKEAFNMPEVAALMSRASGKPISFHNETVEEAYASRAKYGAPDWEVAGWVTSYTAVAAGEMATVTDEVRRLAGHEPMTLTEYLGTHPESLDHVASG